MLVSFSECIGYDFISGNIYEIARSNIKDIVALYIKCLKYLYNI